tara:strand:+ start:360 stop:470 length:111 start_codon:yes stop_codon:yes gene_type:complete
MYESLDAMLMLVERFVTPGWSVVLEALHAAVPGQDL